jgi:PilZ domain
VASVEITDLQSEKRLSARTKDLSLFGCFVQTPTPLMENTKVGIRMSRNGVNFVAQGKVAYARPDLGMGVAFTSIEPSSLAILDAWLAELRN